MRCPSPGCNATQFRIEQSNGANFLVCAEGHLISRDYSVELENMCQDIARSVKGVSTDVVAHAQVIIKELKDIKKVLNELSDAD